MADVDDYTIVSAAPGFDVLTYSPGSLDSDSYYSRPVVAWAILSDAEGFVRAFPIAALADEHLNADLAVLMPSGEIVCGEMEWNSLRAWLDFCKENAGKEPESPQRSAPVLALDSFRRDKIKVP